MGSHSAAVQPSSAAFSAPGFATRAYRADIAAGARSSASDSGWVSLACQLELAAELAEPQATTHLRRAEVLAGEIAEPNALARVVLEWQTAPPGALEAIVAVADQAELSHAFRLAAHVLDSLAAANRSLTALERGRIVARRARIAHKLGEVEQALDRYMQLLRFGRDEQIPELEARGWAGRAILAQVRGNYPEVRRCARRAARLADKNGLIKISRDAHHSLMIAAAMAGEFDDALAHGWHLYNTSLGDATNQADALLNVAQLLLDSGHAAEARAGFAAVVSRPVPARIMLPALGGLAMANAALGEERVVFWVASEVARIEEAGASSFAVASARLECAMAFVGLHRPAPAAQQARAALRLARAGGFHEVAYKAESLDVSMPVGAPARGPLGPRGAAVALNVEQLEPGPMPVHVAVEFSSSEV